VESFDSDSNRRDEVVMEILKAEDHPDLRFETDWISDSVIRNLLETGKGSLKGILSLAGRSYPVSFQMDFFSEGGNYRIEGHLDTNYTAFDMEPPVGGPGGLIAIVKDKLELLAHLQSAQITGFEEAIK
jgi:polyisoprenoid-binding protein YceI